jgi:predicted molibdopterin-dependent oxidoreductase YjgC
MRREGSWDEGKQTVTDTICPYCGVGCTLQLAVQDNAIVKVTSPLDHSVTRGHLCIKGRFGWQFVQNRGASKEAPVKDTGRQGKQGRRT